MGPQDAAAIPVAGEMLNSIKFEEFVADLQEIYHNSKTDQGLFNNKKNDFMLLAILVINKTAIQSTKCNYVTNTSGHRCYDQHYARVQP